MPALAKVNLPSASDQGEKDEMNLAASQRPGGYPLYEYTDSANKALFPKSVAGET